VLPLAEQGGEPVAEERLDSHDLKILLLWILAGLVGAGIAFRFFFAAFPEVAVDFRISRPAAVEQARQFLAGQGYRLADYQSSIVFDVDNNAKTYLEREVGLEQANRLMASEVNVWRWKVRFFRPQKQEEFSVRLDPSGRVVGMKHVIEEAREGAHLEREAARAIAKEFLRSRVRTNLAAYDFLPEQSNSTERPKRRDWSFTWERRGFKAKEAPYRLRVTLLGDAAGGYEEFLKVPEAWERDFERLRSSNLLYQWIAQVPWLFLQGSVFAVLFVLGMRGQVRWSGALKLGFLLAALFFLMEMNSWPLERAHYDTNSSYTGFFLQRLAAAAGSSVLLGMLVALTVAAAEPLYRRDHPGKLRLGRAFTLSGLRSKEFLRACVIGLTLAAAHIGFVVAFYVVGKRFGFWTPQDIKYTDAVSTALPWVYPLAISLFAATNEEFLFRLFAIPVLLRGTKSRWVAVVLPAFIWGFLHSAYPVEPGYARGIEVGLIGVVAGWVMLRWGILATLVWHYTVDALLIGLFLLRSESLYFRLSGAAVTGAVLLPLAFAVVSYVSRGRFEADEALLNRAQPLVVSEVEGLPEPTGVARTYEALSTRALGRFLLVGALGLTLAHIGKPKTIGEFVRFAITPQQAAQRANQLLRQRIPEVREPGPGGEYRRVALSSYRRTVVFDSEFDPYASEYLRRQVGIAGANRLYRDKVPAAFWRVRYFRDSQKEEYAVLLRLDGTWHSLEHLLDEKAPGASLTKEGAQARAEAFLRDEKKFDLGKWKLVEASSEKRPNRADHNLVWEETEAVGEAHVRAELKVLGEEVSGYRVFVKIPEEWERGQKKATLGSILYGVFRTVLGLAFAGAVLVLFFKNLRQQQVPWRRLALWALWGGLALVVSIGNAWPLLLASYPTQMPLRTFLAIVLMGEFVVVGMAYSGLLFLFGLASFFLAQQVSEDRLPSWAGMPPAYYRDALCVGVAGCGVLMGLSRLGEFADNLWPTDKKALAAALPVNMDTIFPAATFIDRSVLGGLFLVGLLALVAGFVGGYLRRPWMRAGLVLAAAAALVGSWGGSADFAKSFLLGLVNVAVIWWGVTRVIRFNLLGYFLAAATTILLPAATQLFRQPGEFYRLNGYAVVVALLVLLAWPLAAWRAALGNASRGMASGSAGNTNAGSSHSGTGSPS